MIFLFIVTLIIISQFVRSYSNFACRLSKQLGTKSLKWRLICHPISSAFSRVDCKSQLSNIYIYIYIYWGMTNCNIALTKLCATKVTPTAFGLIHLCFAPNSFSCPTDKQFALNSLWGNRNPCQTDKEFGQNCLSVGQQFQLPHR